MIRAKMRVTQKMVTSESPTNPYGQVVLMPVYDPECPEDQKFSAATPSGKIELTLTAPGVYEKFPVGAEFYVDFNQIEDAG